MALKKRIKFFFIRKLSKLLIHVIFFTCKKITEGEEEYKLIKSTGKPVIIIFWHRHIFHCIYKFRNSGVRPLISYSPDGELVSQVAEEFGMEPVRGSSSKGGARAFIEILNSIKNTNSEILITADGPRGPLREIKDGTILLAEKTGAAVVPVSWYSSKVKIFEKSWDKFIIPRLFSKVIFTFGSPIFIPDGITKKDRDTYKIKLKTALDELENTIIDKLKK